MTEDNVRKAEEEGYEKRFKLSSTFNTSNMVCFDLNSKIKKYSSAEEILVDFYHKRLEYYGLRKVSYSHATAGQSLTCSNISQMSYRMSLNDCRTRRGSCR